MCNCLVNGYLMVMFGHPGDYHETVFIGTDSIMCSHDDLVLHDIYSMISVNVMYYVPGNIMPGFTGYFKRAVPSHITTLE